jgi:hypothetical protein
MMKEYLINKIANQFHNNCLISALQSLANWIKVIKNIRKLPIYNT